MARFVAGFSLFAILALFTFVPSQSAAQSDPTSGILPFSTHVSGLIDSVDLATGNILITIPVRNKVGPIPFNYAVVSNNHVYTWTASLPPNGPETFIEVSGVDEAYPQGFLGQLSMGAYLRPTYWETQRWCGGDQDDEVFIWYVVDSTGASHPTGVKTDQDGCYAPPQGAVTTDGSGYTVNFTAYNTGNIYDRAGNLVGNASANSISDPDGNQITWSSSGNYNDTLIPYPGTPYALSATYPSPNSPNPATYQYTDANGDFQTVQVNYGTYQIMTDFGCANEQDIGGVPRYLPSSINVPGSGTYTIQYEQTPYNAGYWTGRIAQITLPSGGYVAYTYGGSNNGFNCSQTEPAVPTLTRTVSDNNGNVNTWTYVNSGTTVNVTDPAGNQTVYTFGGNPAQGVPLMQISASYYQGTASGTPLKTVLTCYNQTAYPCTSWNPQSAVQITQTDVYTSYNGAPATWIETKYDGYGNVTEVKSYSATGGFGGATLVSDKLIYYGQSWNNNSSRCYPYPQGDYIYDTPCYTQTLNSSGAVVAQTQITYSNTGHPLSTSKWVSNSNSPLTSSATYNSNGTVNRATDANGTYFQYSYGTGSCNGLLPTGVAISGAGVSESRSMTWDCNGGVQTSLTDENGKITYTDFTYKGEADPFYRPVAVVDPLSNTTAFGYTFTSYESTMNFNGSVSTTDSLITADGLARNIFEQKRQGPNSSSFDTTQTTYGWGSASGACTTQPPFTIGPCTTQSMPYAGPQGQPGQGAPSGTKFTTTQYDALGRPITVTDGGGGTTSYQYIKNDVLQTVGPTQTFQKQLEYDGVGRLTSVCEITSASGSGSCGQSHSASGFLTLYTYDALGNLLTVTQNAQPGAIGGQQTRTFTYDGLSRLTSETNPEWGPGTATYTYDVACGPYSASNGDMTKKVDSAGNTTCYAYDGLHRLTDAGNGTSTCRHLRYDNNVTPPTGITVSNTQARLEEAYTDACGGSKITDEWFGYDADGRMTDVYESTPHSGTPYYHTSACYWPNGTMESLSGIPGVPAIYYGNSTCTNSGNGLDGEGRVTQVAAASGTSPASSITYSPTTTSTALAGSLTGVSFTSGDSDSFSYDPNTGRQTGYTFSVNGETDTGTLGWNQNGTLGTLQIADLISFSDDSQICSYFYDALGRLGGVDSNGYSVDCGSIWSQLLTFDAFGNIAKSGSLTFLPTYSPTTNRYTLSGINVQYDGNGNLLTDNLNTYTWDPSFGNPTSVNGINLVYDALGQMVEQQGGANTEILYSPAGKTALMNGQTLTKAFVGVPGGGTAIYNSNGLAYYRHPDWLGSSRLTSTVSPPTQGYPTTAYAPFGEPYSSHSLQSDASFTGQNSDTVSTLYDFTFREYSPSQGRWISPDPAGLSVADPTNPQTWNRYAYVLNNPLGAIDPSGLELIELDWDGGSGLFDSDDLIAAGFNIQFGENGDVSSIDPPSDAVSLMDSSGNMVATIGPDSNIAAGVVQLDQSITVSASPTDVDTIPVTSNWTVLPGAAGGPMAPTNQQRAILTTAYKRSMHDLGCVGLGGLVAAGSQAASAPIIPKSAVLGSNRTGTSVASTILNGPNIGQSLPTPEGMPGTSSFAWTSTANLGRFVSRWLPYAGTVYGAYKMNKCLSSSPSGK